MAAPSSARILVSSNGAVDGAIRNHGSALHDGLTRLELDPLDSACHRRRTTETIANACFPVFVDGDLKPTADDGGDVNLCRSRPQRDDRDCGNHDHGDDGRYMFLYTAPTRGP